MSFSGASIQNAIYIAQEPPEWPVGPEDWERAAEEKLDAGAFGYIAGGAGGESTMRANLAAFERWRIRPRMLTGNAKRDISVEVLGTHSPAPFFFAPVGVLSIASRGGRGRRRRARPRRRGVPMIVSSAATHSLEEVAETGCPRWFQLYWVNDREICASFVSRAEEAGYGAIVVTLDTLDARLAAARPAPRVPAVHPGRGLRAVLQRPRVPGEARQAACRGSAHRRRDDARDLLEPRAHLGRPRLAPGADEAAAARQGRALRRRRAPRARARHRRRDRVEPRRPPGRRRRRGARRARRGARRAARRGRADGRRHPPRRRRGEGDGARRRRRSARAPVRLRARRRRDSAGSRSSPRT